MAGKYIPGRGPLTALLCVLGEAPGQREQESGRPFVGPSGQLQEGYMKRAGIDPSQMRYENVYPFMPPGKGGVITSVPREELAQWSEDCLARLDQLTEVKIIVPVGNTALSCLTGFTKITQRRGSIYQWQQNTGRKVKVIPTIHPAAILRDTTLEYRTVKDWERIARELLRDPQVVYPSREFLLDPSPEILETWLGLLEQQPPNHPLYIDIETNPKAKKILCVGFAFGSDLGVSLSWTGKYKEVIKSLCESDRPKGLQNGLYDCYWLRMYGIEVRRYERDCLAMNHLLRPNDTHSLAYMTSIHTDEPYYKGGDDEDDEKIWEREKIDWYALQEYNARDGMVEWEIGEEKLWPLVCERGLEDIYYERYVALFPPLLDMMTHGVKVDREIMQEQYQQYMQEALACKVQAEELCLRQLFTITGKARQVVYKKISGQSLTPEDEKALTRLRTPIEEVEQEILEKGISNDVLKDLLYKQWRLPQQRSRKTRALTVDENALRKLLQVVEKRGEGIQGQFIQAVLRYRYTKKLSEFYAPSRIDEDGRMRCEYTYATRPSRLASRKNPMGGGANLQNQSRKVRGMFLADYECVLVEVDLSQIQARFVYAMAYQVSSDPRLLKLATNKPWIDDIHSENAAAMFGVSYSSFMFDMQREKDDPLRQEREQQRYKGKIVEHASNFGLQASHLQEVFLKGEFGIYVSLRECEELIHKKFQAKPGILDWQRSIREEILGTGGLTNAWEDRIDLSYERPGEDLWRKGYAWKPQSDEARHMNLLGLIPVHRYIKEKGYKSKLNMQVHDALVMSHRPEESYDITRFLVESLEQEREYYGVTLSIPCSVKVGKTWKGEWEWKKMPEREEYERKIEEVLRG